MLDNDTMADGIPLRIDPNSVKVLGEGVEQTAFASGNVVRFVPWAKGLTTEQPVTVEYAAYPGGYAGARPDGSHHHPRHPPAEHGRAQPGAGRPQLLVVGHGR